MKYQRRKTVPTLRKLVSDGREVSTEDAQSKGSKSRKAGPTTRDHRGQRARRSGGQGEANEGRGTRRRRRSGTTAGWTAGARCGQGRLGAPGCVPRPSRPRRPSAGPGPGSDRRPPPAEARAGESDQATRPLPVRPRGRETRTGSRGRKSRGAVRGSPLKPRGLGSRLCGGGVLRPAGRRPSPGQHHPARGPLTSPSQPPQPPQAWTRFVTGARLPAQRRRRACAVASVPRERGQRTIPAFNRSRPAAPPLALSPPPRATSRPLRSEAPPPLDSTSRPLGAAAAVAALAPTEISRFGLLSRLALPSSRENGRLASIKSACPVEVRV